MCVYVHVYVYIWARSFDDDDGTHQNVLGTHARPKRARTCNAQQPRIFTPYTRSHLHLLFSFSHSLTSGGIHITLHRNSPAFVHGSDVHIYVVYYIVVKCSTRWWMYQQSVCVCACACTNASTQIMPLFFINWRSLLCNFVRRCRTEPQRVLRSGLSLSLYLSRTLALFFSSGEKAKKQARALAHAKPRPNRVKILRALIALARRECKRINMCTLYW